MSLAGATADPRVDFHHHALVPEYVDTLGAHGITAQPGVPFPNWSAEASLRRLDDLGIDRALLSIASPGFHFPDRTDTKALTQRCADALAHQCDAHPERFGFLAPMPLPYVQAAVDQSARALDELGADGVSLVTNYNGIQLGAPEWDPLMRALDERAALVHVHPTMPCWWSDSSACEPALVEYPFETTRAFVELTVHRVFSRFPRIRWVFAHGGGTLPYLAARIFGPDLSRPPSGGDTLDVALDASRFDSALVAPGPALDALTALVGPDRIVLGTDFPFAT